MMEKGYTEMNGLPTVGNSVVGNPSLLESTLSITIYIPPVSSISRCLHSSYDSYVYSNIFRPNNIFRLGAACPSNYNPADYFVQMLAVVPGREMSCRHAINTVCNAFQKSNHGVKIALEAEATNGEFEDTLRDSKDPKNRSPYKATWCEQFRAVLWRSWLSVIKEPILIKIRLLQTIVGHVVLLLLLVIIIIS